MKCAICSRFLDNHEDPLSQNCAGQCVGCVIQAEGSPIWDNFIIEMRDRIISLEETVKVLSDEHD